MNKIYYMDAKCHQNAQVQDEVCHLNQGKHSEWSFCCKNSTSELTVGFNKGSVVMVRFDNPSNQHSAWSASQEDG
jgi:hypothetical protein